MSAPSPMVPHCLSLQPDRVVLLAEAALVPLLAPLLPAAIILSDAAALPALLDVLPPASTRLVVAGAIDGDAVPAAVLARCQAGAIGLHPAPPAYPGRGGSHLALYDHAAFFGVTAHVLDDRRECSPILAVDRFPIPSQIGAQALHGAALRALRPLLARLAPAILGQEAWTLPPAENWGTPLPYAAVQTLATIPPDLNPFEAGSRRRAFHAAPPAPLSALPDRLILLSTPDLLPALTARLPGVRTATSLDALERLLDDSEGLDVRLICIGFTQTVPPPLLDRCRAGAINLHAAPPSYPGSAGNHLALYEGAEQYGCTLHLMVGAADAGPILAVSAFPVPPTAGHRGLDELLCQDVLAFLERMAPCLYGLADWPAPPPVTWATSARRPADILALAHIMPDLSEAEIQRRVRAFGDGPDSALTLWVDGAPRPFTPGGRMQGWVDGVVDGAIQGWVRDEGRPPVRVRIEINGRYVGDLTADRDRADVAAAGHGDGRCGFRLPLADLPAGAQRVELLLPDDQWRRVPGSPVILTDSAA